jgi:hypothetical protein
VFQVMVKKAIACQIHRTCPSASCTREGCERWQVSSLTKFLDRVDPPLSTYDKRKDHWLNDCADEWYMTMTTLDARPKLPSHLHKTEE